MILGFWIQRYFSRFQTFSKFKIKLSFCMFQNCQILITSHKLVRFNVERFKSVFSGRMETVSVKKQLYRHLNN